MREVNKYIGCLNHFEKYIKNNVPYDSHMQLINFLYIPYAVGLNVTFPIEFSKFINGEGYTKFEEFIKSNPLIIRFCKLCFYGTESELDDIRIYEDFKKYYNLIFIEKNNSSKLQIDNQTVYKSDFKDLESEISLLGTIAEFQEQKQIDE